MLLELVGNIYIYIYIEIITLYLLLIWGIIKFDYVCMLFGVTLWYFEFYRYNMWNSTPYKPTDCKLFSGKNKIIMTISLKYKRNLWCEIIIEVMIIWFRWFDMDHKKQAANVYVMDFCIRQITVYVSLCLFLFNLLFF